MSPLVIQRDILKITIITRLINETHAINRSTTSHIIAIFNSILTQLTRALIINMSTSHKTWLWIVSTYIRNSHGSTNNSSMSKTLRDKRTRRLLDEQTIDQVLSLTSPRIVKICSQCRCRIIISRTRQNQLTSLTFKASISSKILRKHSNHAITRTSVHIKRKPLSN